jgi:hypothetical protein
MRAGGSAVVRYRQRSVTARGWRSAVYR